LVAASARTTSDWQKLAKVPEEQFEKALAAPEKPTTNGIIANVTLPMVISLFTDRH
jgi:hypothetical protein